ncbi:MAG: hypothetical protein ACK5OB_21100 [Pirellula sp.]
MPDPKACKTSVPLMYNKEVQNAASAAPTHRPRLRTHPHALLNIDSIRESTGRLVRIE